ncbi:MAG TPA: pyridoxal phosphate-dependent aminotransferase [Acidimicrobiales bacterium]|nr:pyridoxal phosphate-dependent aminotransferase [Acidimicrobiales bacterium]
MIADAVPLSPTLALNEDLEARRAAGQPVLHLGFGEAGLPALPGLTRALRRAAPRNRYAPVAGSAEARGAAAGWFRRRDLPTDAAQVVLAPGSKPLLYAVIAALPGAVVLPRPSWVSYAAQAALAGKAVVGVPVPAAAGGVPDPDLLPDALARARRAGQRPGILLLTLPDNPTGTLAGPGLLSRICAIAGEHDLVVVCDEIYRDLCYEWPDFRGPAHLLPERTIVTSGLSKSVALGGWRIGFARFPSSTFGDDARRRVVGVASEVWSSMAGPMQDVAAHVLAEPPEVVDHVEASRRLHRTVARAVHDDLLAAGARCRTPDAAFYLYPDLAPWRDGLARLGVTTGAVLARHLLDRHGVGVLPGGSFGDDPAALRFRAATSLLYGRTDDQRWAALRSPDPLALPWIAEALATLRATWAALAG